MNDYEVIIIGGGLSGLISAIELGNNGLKVLVIEKNAYPNHKVCGEYVSNEVLEYLNKLGFSPFDLSAKKIKNFELTAQSGKSVKSKLPLGGFGLSRYAFDEALYKIALSKNVDFHLNDSAEQIEKKLNLFEVTTLKKLTFSGKLLIAAHGKRSLMDKELKRDFFEKRSSYIAVKSHYKGDFPEDLVALHNFKNGYCGLSMVETGAINVCYLTKDSNLKAFKNIREMELGLISKNPHLKKVFQEWEPVFNKPLTISQIYFNKKNLVENDIFMTGDAAGLIYPLCGNGMAMAIHSAKILSEIIILYFNHKIDFQTLKKTYLKEWNNKFSGRLAFGRFFQQFFGSVYSSEFAVNGLKIFPFLSKPIISLTHGKTIK
jgi:flavin-dependent dehydrogenase